MTATAALARLDAAGVRVRLRDDGSLNLTAAAPPPPAVLALARAHRDGIAALLAEQAQQAACRGFVPITPATTTSPLAPARTGSPFFPGIPPEWCEGVARLATTPAPPTIQPWRWAVLAATAARLLRDYGAALHAAGWDALDVWGLHALAPANYPPGWGLAWLLGAHGAVLDVAPAVVSMTREAGGARLAYRKQHAQARADCLPAWNLPGASA